MPDSQQVALITGGGRRRVGHRVALALADAGYALALHYHASKNQALATAAEFHDRGVTCEIFQANVRVESDVDRMFDAIRDRFGRLDVLVATAAIWKPVPLEEVSAAELTEHFEVNTLGTFLCARRAGLLMVGQSEGGVIITIGDWAIERPYPDFAPYFVSKGAIPTLTRVLAVELARRNPRVRVNCIHPGPVMFPPDASQEERQSMIDSTLVRQADCPETVAHAVQFLIENPFVTGICLPVDGGRSIFAGESRSRPRPI